ncbi:MAG: AMP-binding protein [Clostridia bacterium]
MKNQLRELPKFDNIKEIIYNSVKLYAENIAFTIKKKVENKTEYINITYEKLLQDINSLGTMLHKKELKRKRVAIIGKNRYEWSISHLACLMGGIVSVPLDKDLQLDELEESLIRSKADAIIFDEKIEEKINIVKANKKTNIKEYICMSELKDYENVPNLLKLGKKIIEDGNHDYENYEVDSKCMSILLFTSGTTAKSKAVMLSQYGIATNVYDMQIVETFLPTDVNIAFLPFHHIFGSTGMIVMLASGVKTVFPDGLRYIKQNLIEYQVSLFVGVPLLIDKMYSNIEKEIETQGKTKLLNIAIKISNILMKLHIDVRRQVFKPIINALGGKMRFIISGGAPLDKEIEKKFNEFGIHIVQGYGLTETSPVIAAENDKYVKLGSVGIPMKHANIEIVNKDEKGIGEITVKGPNVMLGYYENEEATAEVLKNGRFYTGDLGFLDDEGFLFITGRKKDMIVLKNGKKVFPEELETLLNRTEDIEESYVFGMKDKEDKSKIKVAVEVVYNKEIVKKKYGEISKEELYTKIWNEIKEINKTLPRYKYITQMILTDEPLIKTTTHKIKRNEEYKKVNDKSK